MAARKQPATQTESKPAPVTKAPKTTSGKKSSSAPKPANAGRTAAVKTPVVESLVSKAEKKGKPPVEKKQAAAKSTDSSIVKSIPAAENTGAGVTCVTKGKKVYRISQNAAAKRFTLWEQVPDGFRKLAQATSPMPLYDKVPWND